MKEVIRRTYLHRLESGFDRTDVVKVITGMRRCGKTVLMRQFAESLRQKGIPDDRIVMMNFESGDLSDIRNHKDLIAEIKKRYSGDRIYVFLDEIQRIESWERAINSLQLDFDADVYITGSNAHLLSGDLSTFIAGRYSELRMLPLSFAEYIELHPGERSRRFEQYIRFGSLPVVDPDADELFERDHLAGIFNTIVIRDVVRNCKGEDSRLLEDIARFIFSNIGNITSCNSIATTIGKDKTKVRAYLDAMQKAFLIHKAERYDIRGKKLLDTLEKYYVSDTGIRNAVLGISSREDESRQIENIVYLELLRRGYDVSVGKYGDAEVDFTARKGDDIEYFQVTMSMIPENVYERETKVIGRIRDSYPKTVLSMDSYLIPLPNGIKHRSVIDWLLEP